MVTWKRKYRKIDGENRLVKVRRIAGREQVRVVGHRNLTDKTARRIGRTRQKGVYSPTDACNRTRKKIGRKLI